MEDQTRLGRQRWMMTGQAMLILLALLALLIAYYWVHKPFTPRQALTFGGALLDLLTVAAMAVIAGGLGRRALSHAGLASVSWAERVALEGALGLAFIAWGALALGMLGLFNGPALWLAMVAAGVVVRREVTGWLADARRLFSQALRPRGRWSAFLTVLVGVLLLTALLRALTPPVAWDALAYHLVGPQRYLQAGRIAAQPDNHFLGFPQTVEVLYGVAMSLFGRDTAAAPVHCLFGVLALLATAGLVRRFADPETGWLAVVLLLSAFSLWVLFGEPYVDLAVMAYGAAALVAAVCWRETRQTGWLALMGLYAGLALGVKYTAGILLLALLFFAAWQAPRQIVRNGAVLVGAALLAFMPWLLKGAILYQNPVYPYFFGGINWDAQRTQNLNTFGAGLLGSGQAWQLPILPIAVTVFGVEKGEGASFTAGPWLLAAWLLLLPGWRWLDGRARQLASDCLLLGLPLLVLWILAAAFTEIGVQTRLIAMALPVAAIAGALGFYALTCRPRKPVDLSFIFRAVLVLTLLLGIIETLSATVRMNVVPYLLGSVARDDFVADNLGTYSFAMRQLGELPAGSTVRLMWETRSYYCPPTVRCTPDMLFDHWGRPIKNGASPGEVFDSWQREGDNYLLVSDTGYKFFASDRNFAAENASFPAELARRMKPIWSDDVGYTLYAWRTP